VPIAKYKGVYALEAATKHSSAEPCPVDATCAVLSVDMLCEELQGLRRENDDLFRVIMQVNGVWVKKGGVVGFVT
jgi:hypothetical protein